MQRGPRRIEMVDAWTQTSDRGSEAEDDKKKKESGAATSGPAIQTADEKPVPLSDLKPKLVESAPGTSSDK